MGRSFSPKQQEVYILDFENMIKVGRSRWPKDRVKQIERDTGQKVTRYSVIPCNASTVEWEMLSQLSDYRIAGEYFIYPYENAVFLLLETVAKYEKKRKEADLAMTIQEKIKVLMVRRGDISAAELSRKLQAKGIALSPQSLSNRLKRGKFSDYEIQKIAEVLNCDVELPPPPAPIFKMRDTGESV